MRSIRVLVLAGLCSACAGLPQSQAGARELLEAARCGRAESGPAERWIADQAGWQGWQSELGRAAGRLGETVLPALDFTREQVLVLYLGSRPTPGYGLSLESGERLSDSTLRLDLASQRPPPDAVMAQVMTSPCLVLALPAGIDSVELHQPSGVRRIQR